MADKKMGRPRKQIDKAQFEKLCILQCTITEMCGYFNCDDMTLNKWCRENYDGKTFSEVFALKRGLGKISLRRYQFQQAEKNPTMAIWLGKQWLGQRDNIEVDNGNNELLSSLTQLVRKQIDNND
jgi:hypothetical protein